MGIGLFCEGLRANWPECDVDIIIPKICEKLICPFFFLFLRRNTSDGSWILGARIDQNPKKNITESHKTLALIHLAPFTWFLTREIVNFLKRSSYCRLIQLIWICEPTTTDWTSTATIQQINIKSLGVEVGMTTQLSIPSSSLIFSLTSSSCSPCSSRDNLVYLHPEFPLIQSQRGLWAPCGWFRWEFLSHGGGGNWTQKMRGSYSRGCTWIPQWGVFRDPSKAWHSRAVLDLERLSADNGYIQLMMVKIPLIDKWDHQLQQKQRINIWIIGPSFSSCHSFQFCRTRKLGGCLLVPGT